MIPSLSTHLPRQAQKAISDIGGIVMDSKDFIMIGEADRDARGETPQPSPPPTIAGTGANSNASTKMDIKKHSASNRSRSTMFLFSPRRDCDTADSNAFRVVFSVVFVMFTFSLL